MCGRIILPRKKHLICSFQPNSFILLPLIIKMADICSIVWACVCVTAAENSSARTHTHKSEPRTQSSYSGAVEITILWCAKWDWTRIAGPRLHRIHRCEHDSSKVDSRTTIHTNESTSSSFIPAMEMGENETGYIFHFYRWHHLMLALCSCVRSSMICCRRATQQKHEGTRGLRHATTHNHNDICRNEECAQLSFRSGRFVGSESCKRFIVSLRFSIRFDDARGKYDK